MYHIVVEKKLKAAQELSENFEVSYLCVVYNIFYSIFSNITWASVARLLFIKSKEF